LDMGIWQPMAWWSHMLDCQLFGLRPGLHHLTNLVFHVANTLLLFTFLRQLTGTLWRSSIVAALFALHPLHVESVAWVAERKDVLSTFVLLLSLITYLRYVEAVRERNSKRKLFYALTFAAFVAGLMSKSMLVTLPLLLLLLDWWPLNRVSSWSNFTKLVV